MPHLTFAICQDGYLLDVMVGLNGQRTAALVAARRPVIAPLLVRAMVDTGSDVTGVASRIVNYLGQPPVVQTTTHTVSGPLSVYLFDVSLSIPRGGNLTGPLLVLDQLRIMEMPSSLPANIEVLFGRDALAKCLFISDGPRDEFTLGD
jgi:hypothetical protein